MFADNFELDADDHFNETCGKILYTSKGLFVFICALCDKKYLYCENLLLHYSQEHILPEENKADIDALNAAPASMCFSGDLNQTSSNGKVDAFKLHLYQNDPLAINAMSGNCFPDDIKIEPNCDGEQGPLTDATEHKSDDIPAETNEIGKKSAELEILEIKEDNLLKEAKKSIKVKVGRVKKKMQEAKASHLSKASAEVKESKKRKVDKQSESAEKTVLETIKVSTEIRCLMCPAIFMDVNEFREHVKEHEHYNCPRCTRSFVAKDRLQVHCGTQCKIFKRPLKCYLCDFIFDHKITLKKHLLRHFPINECECRKCFAKFGSQDSLQEHIRSNHSDERRYDCHICGASILRLSNFRNHVLCHSEENKIIQCEDCPRRFFRRADLKKHFLICHSNERPHLCSECGASFPTLSILNAHIRKRHTVQEKNEKCEICSKMFHSKQGLSRHLVKHSNERSHVCSICNATFKERKTLAQHLKIHENKRAYKCELCQKGFNQRPALVSHMKSHM